MHQRVTTGTGVGAGQDMVTGRERVEDCPLQQTAGPEDEQILGHGKLQRDTLIGPNEEHSTTLQRDFCLNCRCGSCHCPLDHEKDAGRVYCQDLVFSDRARDLVERSDTRVYTLPLGSRAPQEQLSSPWRPTSGPWQRSRWPLWLPILGCLIGNPAPSIPL